MRKCGKDFNHRWTQILYEDAEQTERDWQNNWGRIIDGEIMQSEWPQKGTKNHKRIAAGRGPNKTRMGQKD
jgi:hypothetical protein